jgi:hypothetical protein
VPVHYTNGFAISRLKWDGVVNNSGTTGYSDFKNIKILFMQGLLINLKLRLPNQKDLLLEFDNNPGFYNDCNRFKWRW